MASDSYKSRFSIEKDEDSFVGSFDDEPLFDLEKYPEGMNEPGSVASAAEGSHEVPPYYSGGPDNCDFYAIRWVLDKNSGFADALRAGKMFLEKHTDENNSYSDITHSATYFQESEGNIDISGEEIADIMENYRDDGLTNSEANTEFLSELPDSADTEQPVTFFRMDTGEFNYTWQKNSIGGFLSHNPLDETVATYIAGTIDAPIELGERDRFESALHDILADAAESLSI